MVSAVFAVKISSWLKEARIVTQSIQGIGARSDPTDDLVIDRMVSFRYFHQTCGYWLPFQLQSITAA